SCGLSVAIIRGIARSHEWKTRWRAAKETGTPVFPGSLGDWDANKRNLVWWSDFYDAVMRHPECPPDDVISNDELLQNWINGLGTKGKGKTPTRPHPPHGQGRSFLDGKGRRIPGVVVGQEKVAVNQPYKVRHN
ncbi:MAG: hypothetical protein FWD53_13515, partial [Phycisphaerales bacterium]|nr:hypothetical protein [Phycisphaerales bacterium]